MYRYPRICLLLLSFILAYILFEQGFFDWMGEVFNGYGYTSVFIGGLLFSFGFTTPFAVGIFLALADQTQPLLAAPIAGIGAFLADLLLFETLRLSLFQDEIKRFRMTKIMQWLHSVFHHERLSENLRQYLLWSFAGIIIASPLPDEFGIALLSSFTNIETRVFSLISVSLNTIGILFILLLGKEWG